MFFDISATVQYNSSMDKIGWAVENQQNSLQEVMQLPVLRQQFLQWVREFFDEKAKTNKSNTDFDIRFITQWKSGFFDAIAYHSLDDLIECIWNNRGDLYDLLNNKNIYLRYFNQIDWIISGLHKRNQFTEIRRKEKEELNSETKDPDRIKKLFDQYDQWELYEKMVRYYSIYLKKNKINGAHMSYPWSDQEYNLEMLIDQMVRTDKRNLTGVRTSLEMMMHNQEYRDEQGNPVFITHGETALEKAKQYLYDSIINHLPKDYELKKEEDWYKITYSWENEEWWGKILQSIEYSINQYRRMWTENWLFWVEDKWHKYWLMNKKWKEILQCKYDEMLVLGEDLYIVKDSTWSYFLLNQREQTKIVYQFSMVRRLTDCVYRVWYKDKIWLINSKWELILECQYTEIECSYDYNKKTYDSIFIIKDERKCWLVDNQWNIVIQCQYQEVEKIGDWLYAVRDWKWRWVVNDKRDILVQCQYQYIEKIGDWLYAVRDWKWRWVVNDKWDILVHCQYQSFRKRDDWIYEVYNADLAKMWIINQYWEVLIEFKYDVIMKLDDDLYSVKNEFRRWIVNTKWKQIVQCKYLGIEKIYNSPWLYKVCLDQWKRSVINQDWREMMWGGQYLDIKCQEWFYFARNIDDKKRSIIDIQWVEKIKIDHEYIQYIGQWLWKVSNDERTRWLINGKWKKILTTNYKEITKINKLFDWLDLLSIRNSQDKLGIYDYNWIWLLEDNFNNITIDKSEDWMKFKIYCRNQDIKQLIMYEYDQLYGLIQSTKTDIALLNALEKNEPSERLKSYLMENSPNQEYRQFQKELWATHPALVKAHNLAIPQSPEQYIGLLQAKKPQVSLVKTVIGRFAPTQEDTDGWGSWRWWFEKWGAMDMRDKNEFTSTGWEQLQNNLLFEQPLPWDAVTELAGSYQWWTRRVLNHGYTKQMSIIAWEEKKNRGVLTDVGVYAWENIVLPVTINQTQITQAYAVIAWKKIPLELNTKANGMTTVVVPQWADTIEREIEQWVPTGLIPSITTEQYRQFRKQYIAEYGADCTFDAYELLPETGMFLDAIKHLSPRDQLIMCEQYVRDMMRYDDENTNSRQKTCQPLDVQLQMCASHRIDIMKEHPEAANKLYVWVCEDASNLLLMMLRKLWFISWKVGWIAWWVGHRRNFVLKPWEKVTMQMI